MTIDLALERTTRNEAVCLTIAAALHALLLLWNPTLLKSEFKKINDFVSVDVVEDSGAPMMPEKPVKMSMLDTLKDMLLTPKSEQIAQNKPEPVRDVAAPLLQEKKRVTPMNFKPQDQTDELAALKNPDQIAPGQRIQNQPMGGPTLESK